MTSCNPFLSVYLLYKNFGWSCKILSIVSLMEFSLGQLSIWLASYYTPLLPMLWAGLWLPLGIQQMKNINLVNAFALCVKVVVSILTLFNILLCGFHWHLCIVFALCFQLHLLIIWCTVLSIRNSRDILSSDPKYLISNYMHIIHSSRNWYIFVHSDIHQWDGFH